MRKRGPRASRRFLGSFSSRSGVATRRLAISRRHHDLLVKALHVPAVLCEVHGQPVQQLRMTGPGAHGAEILGRLDDAGAEELGPHSVHGDARGQRIRARYRPFRQRAPIQRHARRKRRQEMRSCRTHALLAIRVDAAGEHIRISEPGRFLADERDSAILGELVQLGVDTRPEILQGARAASSR